MAHDLRPIRPRRSACGAIRRLRRPATGFAETAFATSRLWRSVRFDVTALATCMIVELPPRGSECIADRHVQIYMRSIEVMIPADIDRGPG
jgi:hypothetical protein